jgi:tripartite-type tricarboxylate transporter receptor subunit TctC
MQAARLLTIGALAGALSFLGDAAFTQVSYPSAPIRVIIPLAPGGAIDVMVRALGRAFEQRNPYGFVVESRAGANTIIAANACKAAPPDGSTICLLSRSSVSINPALYKNLSYDPIKDFEPITNLAFAHQVLILNKNVPVKDFKELVAYSKQNPEKLNFGSFGVGGDTHLVVEWIKHETGAKMTHIPYKGASDAMLAFKSGDIQLIYLIIGNPTSRARSTKARSGGCWSRDRAAIPWFRMCLRSQRADCRPTSPRSRPGSACSRRRGRRRISSGSSTRNSPPS